MSQFLGKISAGSFDELILPRLGCALFYQTSSLPEALIAMETGLVTAMHDVTEGGVLGAVYEMAIASGLGVSVRNEDLPVGHAQQQVTRLFGIDERFCIGAGAMVIAVKQGNETQVISALFGRGIKATIIGEFTDKAQGLCLSTGGREEQLPYHEKDPYWAAFFQAFKKGWT